MASHRGREGAFASGGGAYCGEEFVWWCVFEDVTVAVVVGEDEDVGCGALCSDLPGGVRACTPLAELQVHKDEVGVQGRGEGDRFRAMPPRIIPGGRRRVLEAPAGTFSQTVVGATVERRCTDE